tara:strand:+ start:910 stop:1278 length:369 start_codon:yes stop_codon:yes gene_type:complete
MKPSHYDVYPVYTCPKCDAEHQQTLEETVFPAGVLCYCGEKLKLETIEKVDVKPYYKNKGAIEQENNVKEVKKESAEDHSDIISGLVSLGHKKSEAKTLIGQFYDGTQTSDELFEEILAGSI